MKNVVSVVSKKIKKEFSLYIYKFKNTFVGTYTVYNWFLWELRE